MHAWGHGRGGRLGLDDPRVHSGNEAVLLPRIIRGFGPGTGRYIVAVSAGKHHTLAATQSGELFSWGSNRDGRLGYGAPDTQPTPRRVGGGLHGVVVTAVAAANRHSVALTAAGDVFTFGSNAAGQLGHGGTAGSGAGGHGACSATPRAVEHLRPRRAVAVAASKKHTVVLVAALTGDTSGGSPASMSISRISCGSGGSGGGSGGGSAKGFSGGEVFTWGHKCVSPRKVNTSAGLGVLAGGYGGHAGQASSSAYQGSGGGEGAGGGCEGGGRRGSSGGGGGRREPLRLHHHCGAIVAVAAGATHSLALTVDGAVLVWASADPLLRCFPVRGVGAAGTGAAGNPTLTSTNPKLAPSSPNLTPSNPNLISTNPNLTPSNPNLTSTNPNLTPCSPNPLP
jgi:hypothetical protein